MIKQELDLLRIMMDDAKIKLPVKHGEPGYLECEIEAANESMKIHDESGHTLEQAKYIATLLNMAPSMISTIERLMAENRSYRNYIASAPDHGVVDYD